MRVVLIGALALAASPAMAMVSGYYDSLNKIGAILALPELPDQLRQQPIGQISEIGKSDGGNGQWMVRTQECDLIVNVIPHFPEDGMVGMTTYTAEIAQGCE